MAITYNYFIFIFDLLTPFLMGDLIACPHLCLLTADAIPHSQVR